MATEPVPERPALALDLCEADFRLFFASTPDPVVAQRAGALIYVNAAFVSAMRGEDAGQFVGMRVIDLIAPEDKERIATQLRDPDPRASRTAQDVRCIRKDQTIATMHYAGFRVGDAKSPTTILMCRDVTERRSQSDALRLAEEEFRSVFEGGPVGVALISLEGKYLRANRAMCKLVGYSEKELQQRTFTDIIHPEDRQSDIELIRKLNSGVIERADFRKRYVHKEGEVIDISLNVALVRGSDGQPIGCVSHVLDITAQLKSAAALRESEGLQRVLLQNLPDVALLMFDRDLRYTVAEGKEVLESLGLDPKRMAGMTVAQVAKAESAARLEALFRRTLAGESVRWDHLRDGRTFDARAYPVRDESGAITGGTLLAYETTRQRALQARAEESEARLSSLIENIGDSMWSLDREGRITAFNARFARDILRAHGVTVALGINMFTFLQGAEHAAALEHHRRCLLGESVSLEWSTTVEGRPMHMLLTHNPIIANGVVTGASLMVKDITHRREIELAVVEKARVVELLQAIAAAANEAISSNVAIEKSLALVAQFNGWPVGHAFQLIDGELCSRGTWYLRDPELLSLRTEAEPYRFRPGRGLPGKVLESKSTSWMKVDPTDLNYPRSPIFRGHGLVSAFAFPVLVGDEVATVVEFLSDRDERPTKEIESLMANVGIQLGRVIERERYAAEVRSLSLTDELTGLNNRRGFMVLAAQQLRTSLRSKRPSAVLFADLDGLKRINDELGHEMGDDAIASFGRVLKRTFRENDIVSRFGGDEFVVFIDSALSSLDGAIARLHQNLREQNQLRPAGAKLSASLGAVEVEQDKGDTLESIVARADAVMYENKRKKKKAG